jgi:hypothetical protein
MPKTSDSKQSLKDQVACDRAELERRAKAQATEGPAASTLLSPQEKVSLFRALFRGREDVYAERFVAKKTGKAGYGPVCANKFVKGLSSSASSRPRWDRLAEAARKPRSQTAFWTSLWCRRW